MRLKRRHMYYYLIIQQLYLKVDRTVTSTLNLKMQQNVMFFVKR